MAKQILHRITDDLDGSDDAAPITFGLDGHQYTIDLSEKNATAMRDALAPFVERANRVAGERPGRGGGGAAPRRTTDHERNQAIRAWALESGIELPGRGRIANGVMQAFDDNDVDALYQATGIERVQPVEEKARRRRKPEAEFSSSP